MNNNFYEGLYTDDEEEYINDLVTQMLNRTLTNYDSVLSTFYPNNNYLSRSFIDNFSIGEFNIFYDSATNLIDNDYENLLHESFQNQPTIERTDVCINFSSQKYNTVECNKYDKSCCICLTEYEKDNMVSITICKHLFHTECITEWSRYKKACPFCRSELIIEKKE